MWSNVNALITVPAWTAELAAVPVPASVLLAAVAAGKTAYLRDGGWAVVVAAAAVVAAIVAVVALVGPFLGRTAAVLGACLRAVRWLSAVSSIPLEWYTRAVRQALRPLRSSEQGPEHQWFRFQTSIVHFWHTLILYMSLLIIKPNKLRWTNSHVG